MQCHHCSPPGLLIVLGGHLGLFHRSLFKTDIKWSAWEIYHICIYSDKIYGQVFHIFAIWSAQAFSLKIYSGFNSSPPGQNGCHFTADIFKCIFIHENVWILFRISLEFVPKGPINNIPALVQIMAWRRIGDKPLSEPMLTPFIDANMRHLGEMS